jgi:hypothetical protein
MKQVERIHERLEARLLLPGGRVSWKVVYVSVHDHDLDDFADHPPELDHESDPVPPDPGVDHEPAEDPVAPQPASPVLLIAVGATLVAIIVLVVAAVLWAVS